MLLICWKIDGGCIHAQTRILLIQTETTYSSCSSDRDVTDRFQCSLDLLYKLKVKESVYIYFQIDVVTLLSRFTC